MSVTSEFEYKVYGHLKQRDGETGNDFYKRLQSFYGCEYCKDYGCNGCGCWQIGGYEFNGAEAGRNGDVIVGDPEPFFIEEWSCAKREHDEYAKELIDEKRNGTLIFAAAIEKAIDLAPDEESAKANYGDIVRSAAAVAVSNTRESSKEVER